jgi:hypothetical protein
VSRKRQGKSTEHRLPRVGREEGMQIDETDEQFADQKLPRHEINSQTLKQPRQRDETLDSEKGRNVNAHQRLTQNVRTRLAVFANLTRTATTPSVSRRLVAMDGESSRVMWIEWKGMCLFMISYSREAS